MSLQSPTIVLALFAAYAALGIATAIGFVSVGIAQVLPRPVAVTLGARLMLLPGAAALWPIVLRRWLRAARRR